MCKCQFPDGVQIKIGDAKLDPCQYELVEVHKNVTVEVIKCSVCGNVEISWRRQDNTEDIIMEEV